MKRSELQTVLDKVSPALSTKGLVPAFACICFTGKVVQTYNDVIALQTKFGSDYVGGVIGKLLQTFVKTAATEEIDFLPDGESLLLKSGRSKLSVTPLSESEFVFKMPSIKKGNKIKCPESLVSAIQRVCLSLGRDPGFPTTMGVTIIPKEKGVYLCSAEGSSAITRVFLKDKDFSEALPGTILLPPQLCDFFLKIASKDSPSNMYLAEDWVIFTFESKLKLFSRLGEEVDPELFEGAVKQHYMPNKKAFVSLPPGTEGALDRALAVLDAAPEKIGTVAVKKSRLRIGATTSAGSLIDVLKLPGHENVSIRLDLTRFKAALQFADSICITEDSVLLKQGTLVHIIAVHYAEGEDA